MQLGRDGRPEHYVSAADYHVLAGHEPGMGILPVLAVAGFLAPPLIGLTGTALLAGGLTGAIKVPGLTKDKKAHKKRMGQFNSALQSAKQAAAEYRARYEAGLLQKAKDIGGCQECVFDPGEPNVIYSMKAPSGVTPAPGPGWSIAGPNAWRYKDKNVWPGVTPRPMPAGKALTPAQQAALALRDKKATQVKTDTLIDDISRQQQQDCLATGGTPRLPGTQSYFCEPACPPGSAWNGKQPWLGGKCEVQPTQQPGLVTRLINWLTGP